MDISEDEELSFSYGESRIKENGLPCFCGSANCLGVLPSEETWDELYELIQIFNSGHVYGEETWDDLYELIQIFYHCVSSLILSMSCQNDWLYNRSLAWSGYLGYTRRESW